MLNTELQKDINIEIEKAGPALKDFLAAKYFRENMDLILKVNKLTLDQGEAVELETILHILGLSDHATIDEALQAECYIDKKEMVSQVTKDVKDYIISKLPQDVAPKDMAPLILSDVSGNEHDEKDLPGKQYSPIQNDSTQKHIDIISESSTLRNDIISSTTDSVANSEKRKDLRTEIEEGYDTSAIAPKVVAYYDDKRSAEMKLEENKNMQNKDLISISVPVLTNTNIMPDAYRELPALEDKVMEREVDIIAQNGGGDGIIRGV